MKKNIAIVVLSATLLLCSCQGAKKPLLPSDLAEANAAAMPEEGDWTASAPSSLSNLDVVDDGLAKGCAIARGGDGLLAYSLINGEHIASFSETANYEVRVSPLCGFLLYFQESNGGYSLVDGFGNKLHSSLSPFTFQENAHDEVVITDSGSLTYARYEKGKDAPSISNQSVFDSERWPSAIDGALLGLDGYRISVGDYFVYVIDERGEVYSSYPAPSFDLNVGSAVAVDGKLLIQESFALPDDAKEYSYYQNGAKYDLRSLSFDLLSGDLKDINLDYLLGTYIGTYSSRKGKTDLAGVSIYEIRDSKAVMESKKVLINSSGKIIEEMNPSLLSGLYATDGGYYSSTLKMAFDRSMRLTADLSAYDSVTPIYGMDCYYAKDGDYASVLSSKGDVLISKGDYSLLSSQYSYDHAILINSTGTGYVYGPDMKLQEIEGTLYPLVGSGVACAITSSEAKIMTPDETLLSLGLSGATASTGGISTINGTHMFVGLTTTSGTSYALLSC